MRPSSNQLLIVSFLISIITLTVLVYHRELKLNDIHHDILFSFFLISLIISSYGLFAGIKKRRTNRRQWVGIVGNLLLIIPLAILSFKYLRYLTQKPDFEIFKLEKFNYNKASINDGDKIKILSISDGKDCTKDETYYYSVIGVVQRNKDTVRILTPCQVLSQNFTDATFNSPDQSKDSIMNVVGYEIKGEKYVIINQDLPYQKIDFNVAIGSLSFKDDKNEILKEELKYKNIDTNLLEAPKHEIK